MRVFDVAAVAVLVIAGSRLLGAQGGVPMDARPCSYQRCALGLLPVLTGLDVVRGASNERIGTLNFFLPRSVTPLFGTGDSARYHADRAFRMRAIGAGLTDAAGAVLAVAAVRGVREHGVRGSNIFVALGGLGLLGFSVPFQFSADGHLSTAIWHYNASL